MSLATGHDLGHGPHFHPLHVVWIGDPAPALAFLSVSAPHVRTVGHDPASALEAVTGGREPVDLLVIDATVAGVDAVRILRACESNQVDLPVVILTSDSRDDVAVRAERHAVCDTVVKTPEFVHQLPAAFAQVRARHDLLSVFRDARETEERFRAIVESQPAVTGFVAPDGTVAAMNQAGLTLLGADRGQVVGQRLNTFFPRDEYDRLSEMLARVADGEHAELDHDLVRPDGGIREVTTRAVPFPHGSGTGALVTFIDRQSTSDVAAAIDVVAERVRLSQALQHALAENDRLRAAAVQPDTASPVAEAALAAARSEAVAEMRAEQAKLADVLEQTTTELRSMEAAYTALRTQHDALGAAHAALREQFATLDEASTALRHGQAEADAARAASSGQLAALAADLQQRDADLQRLQADLRQRDAELQQRDAELQQRDAELRRRDAEVVDHARLRAADADALARSGRELDDVRAALEAAVRSLRDEQDRRASLEQSLDQERAVQSEVGGTLDATRQRLTALEAEHAQLTGALAAARADRDAMAADSRRLQALAAEAQAQWTRAAETLLAQHADALAAVAAERDRLKNTLDEANAERDRLAGALADREAAVRETVQLREQDLRAAEAAGAARFEAERDTLRDALHQALAQVSALEAELAAERGRQAQARAATEAEHLFALRATDAERTRLADLLDRHQAESRSIETRWATERARLAQAVDAARTEQRSVVTVLERERARLAAALGLAEGRLRALEEGTQQSARLAAEAAALEATRTALRAADTRCQQLVEELTTARAAVTRAESRVTVLEQQLAVADAVQGPAPVGERSLEDDHRAVAQLRTELLRLLVDTDIRNQTLADVPASESAFGQLQA